MQPREDAMAGEVMVVARASVRPEETGRLMAAVAGFVAATRLEPGCLDYDLYVSAGTPTEIATVERWSSAAAAAAHMAAPHTTAFLALAASCVAAPPVIRTLPLQ
jgi:quinol monooxygenase YgiN